MTAKFYTVFEEEIIYAGQNFGKAEEAMTIFQDVVDANGGNVAIWANHVGDIDGWSGDGILIRAYRKPKIKAD